MAVERPREFSATTTCIYRFVGAVPPAGFPLLLDDDDRGPEAQRARIMGQRIRKRVSHTTAFTITQENSAVLSSKLDEGHTLKELDAWAKTLDENGTDREKIMKTISVATKLNDKSLLRSVLLPCRQALFVGFVSQNQPPPATSAPYGLNHARVVVEGRMTSVRQMFTWAADDRTEEEDDDSKNKLYRESTRISGSVRVCGQDVGIIVDGQHILTKSGVLVVPESS